VCCKVVVLSLCAKLNGLSQPCLLPLKRCVPHASTVLTMCLLKMSKTVRRADRTEREIYQDVFKRLVPPTPDGRGADRVRWVTGWETVTVCFAQVFWVDESPMPERALEVDTSHGYSPRGWPSPLVWCSVVCCFGTHCVYRASAWLFHPVLSLDVAISLLPMALGAPLVQCTHMRVCWGTWASTVRVSFVVPSTRMCLHGMWRCQVVCFMG